VNATSTAASCWILPPSATISQGGKIQQLAAVEVAFTADYLDYMAEWARRYEGEIRQLLDLAAFSDDQPGDVIGTLTDAGGNFAQPARGGGVHRRLSRLHGRMGAAL
jgi:hypothetical protein